MHAHKSFMFAVSFVLCLLMPNLHAADVNLLPLSSIKIIVAPSSTKNVVKYVIFNSSSSTSYNLVLQPIRGLVAKIGVGLCGNAFRLAKKKSCILALQINAAKMRNPTKGGPTLCKKENANACFSPIGNDQLNLLRDHGVSFKPLSNIKLTVPSNRTAKIYYLLSNLKPNAIQLSLQAIPGIQSLLGITGSIPYCGNNFKLGKKKSCLLVLQITGSQIAKRITRGPLVCLKGKNTCYQPLPGKRLNITQGMPTNLATIEAQEPLFPISIVKGDSVQVHIKNTSAVNAKGIKVAEHPELTCPTLTQNTICTLNYKPAATLDVGIYPFTVKGSNTNTIHGQIILTSGGNPSPEPKIDKITPSFGSQQGQEQISIDGQNLQPHPQVYLGNQLCTNVGATNTTLTAITPSQFQGTTMNTPVDVKVKTDNGEFILANGFTYLAAAPSCSDNQKNGNESDVDCGGSCAACNEGSKCNGGTDCQSGMCVTGFCQAPACGDGFINGDEICDDGNTLDGDGCSSSCTKEPGFECTGEQRSFCTDINECVVNNGGCDPNASCTDGFGSHTCSCNSGFFGNGISCTAYPTCPIGNYVSVSGTPTSAPVCTACPMGTYSTIEDSPSCSDWTNCTAGNYISAPGTATSDRACSACAAGTYSSTPNATNCNAWSSCNPGTFVSAFGTTTSDQACSACAAGTYSSTPNATNCNAWSSCNPGTYVSSPGTTTSDRTCSMCTAGTYSATVNAQSCSVCPDGTTSLSGATSCN